MKKQQQILEKAFTGAESSKFVHLNEEQANAFVDYIVNESKLLGRARVLKMQKPNMPIPRLVDSGRFMKPGKTGVKQDSSTYQKFSIAQRTLNTKIVKGAFEMTDEELTDNIEGQSITDHIISIVTRKLGNELEETGLYARKRHGASEDPVSALDMFNGLKYYANSEGNVVDGNDTGLFSDRYIARNKFTKMIKTLPTKYRQTAEILLGADLLIDYQELYDSTADQTVRTQLKQIVNGRPLTEIPLMKTEEPIATATTTTVDGAHTAGATTLSVADASGLSVGDYIAINLGGQAEMVFQIATKSTNDLTLEADYNAEWGATVPYALAGGETVTKVTLDATDSFLMDPRNLVYGIQTATEGNGPAITFEIERVPNVGYIRHWKARMDVNVENPEAIVTLKNAKVK